MFTIFSYLPAIFVAAFYANFPDQLQLEGGQGQGRAGVTLERRFKPLATATATGNIHFHLHFRIRIRIRLRPPSWAYVGAWSASQWAMKVFFNSTDPHNSLCQC